MREVQPQVEIMRVALITTGEREGTERDTVEFSKQREKGQK